MRQTVDCILTTRNLGGLTIINRVSEKAHSGKQFKKKKKNLSSVVILFIYLFTKWSTQLDDNTGQRFVKYSLKHVTTKVFDAILYIDKPEKKEE